MSGFNEARYCDLAEYCEGMGRRIEANRVKLGEPLEVRLELGEGGEHVAVSYPTVVTGIELKAPHNEPQYYLAHLSIMGADGRPAGNFRWQLNKGHINPQNTKRRQLKVGKQVVQSGYLIKWDDKHEADAPVSDSIASLPLNT